MKDIALSRNHIGSFKPYNPKVMTRFQGHQSPVQGPPSDPPNRPLFSDKLVEGQLEVIIRVMQAVEQGPAEAFGRLKDEAQEGNAMSALKLSLLSRVGFSNQIHHDDTLFTPGSPCTYAQVIIKSALDKKVIIGRAHFSPIHGQVFTPLFEVDMGLNKSYQALQAEYNHKPVNEDLFDSALGALSQAAQQELEQAYLRTHGTDGPHPKTQV